MQTLLFGLPLFSLLDVALGRGADDYWSEDYDQSQNCARGERIAELRAKEHNEMEMAGASQCSSESVSEGEDKATVFSKCKMSLAKQVQRLCFFTAVNSSGELLYCYNRRIITCCFDKHTCVKDWSVMQQKVYTVARDFLQDKQAYLDTHIRPMGYKTCHLLNTSLDASPCAADCKRFEQQRFAEDCRQRGGFFKCCIRRDAAFCHECRFCCTLAMCTYPAPSTGPAGFANTVFDKPALELKDQKKKQMASELFSSLQHIYKSWDYRCLVADSHPDPEKWRTYDMHGYRIASNQEMYNKVDTFKFDNNFNNWINPKVLAKFTRKPRKAWKRAYGFPYTTGVHWDGRDINTGDASPCWWRCAKLETTKFAKACADNGGFFKCCITVFTLNIFETARNRLIHEGLIRDKQRWNCKPGEKKDPCMVCRCEGVCTKVDTGTGQPIQIFKRRYKKEHKVGGPDQSPQHPTGLRFSFCQIGDFCQFPIKWEYDTIAYRMAASKKELCTRTKKVPLSEQHQQHPEFEDYCMGAKSSNIFTCPKKILGNSKDQLLMFINRKFSEHGCCSKDAAPKKKKKIRSRSNSRSRSAYDGQRLVSVSTSKKKKKRKKKNRSQKEKGKKKKKYWRKY